MYFCLYTNEGIRKVNAIRYFFIGQWIYNSLRDYAKSRDERPTRRNLRSRNSIALQIFLSSIHQLALTGFLFYSEITLVQILLL